MSRVSSRLLVATLFCGVLGTAFYAHATDTPSVTNTAPAVPTQIWRSDAGLVEAEKLIATGRYVDALTYLDQVIARNLHNIEAHVHSGLVWYHLGNMDKARTSLKSAQIIDRNHIGMHVILGMVALKEQKIDEASDYLSVIRVLCRGETCPEYQTLLRMIRETPQPESKPWYRF